MDIALLVPLARAELTAAQWHERIENVRCILDMLYCSQVLGGLPQLSWKEAKKLTFPEYMPTGRTKKRVIARS